MTRAYVYVVESPSPDDLFDGRTEGRALCEAFSLSEIKHSYTVCLDYENLMKAFQIGADSRFLSEFLRHQKSDTRDKFVPIVHISAHGTEDGIVLSCGHHVSWADLRLLLKPINDAMPNGLLVCFSSCKGRAQRSAPIYDVRGREAVLSLGGGSLSDVHWHDALVGFITFYHHLFTGSTIQNAVDAMKIASTHNDLFFEVGIITKKKFIDYVNTSKLVNSSSTFGGIFDFPRTGD
ncbi:hypothetical protein [Pannonibacter sp. SL95]|uniref:hypothetical protein n=1 Tax=Pannonibacter sp. SL95 TaxID=2995153 RepID=UPI0022749AC1|nr:hypothetical protein [Pannonibacter sp. SL95]MCY1704455.1 hypothetical protein [Pannonibacter sp. SL95]